MQHIAHGAELQSRKVEETTVAVEAIANDNNRLAVRLREYHEKTNPVLELFRRKELVITVDARADRDAVQQEIRSKLGLPPFVAPDAGSSETEGVSGR